MKYLKEVIVPYFKKQRINEGLEANQKALVIMDVFTGQMTLRSLPVTKNTTYALKMYLQT